MFQSLDPRVYKRIGAPIKGSTYVSLLREHGVLELGTRQEHFPFSCTVIGCSERVGSIRLLVQVCLVDVKKQFVFRGEIPDEALNRHPIYFGPAILL